MTGRVTRRRALQGGAAAVGGFAAVVYAPLAVGGNFEQLVADRLGIGEELASTLLERARERYGDAEYDARAALFAFAFRGPTSVAAPASVRRSAAAALVGPMLDRPAANLAYARAGRDPSQEACNGLVRES